MELPDKTCNLKKTIQGPIERRRVGDYRGFVKAANEAEPGWILDSDEPPQSLKEYDPEWARAFASGTAGASCDRTQMLSHVRCPVLFAHHFRTPDPTKVGELQRGSL